VLGVLRYLGGHLMHLAGQLVQLAHHQIALVHRLLRGAGAVMDLLHLVDHPLQALRHRRQLALFLLLILLQPQDETVVAGDDVGQLVALAPLWQGFCLPGLVELQEGRAQAQQRPDQPAALHQRKQQGDQYQTERQTAEDGGQPLVDRLAGGGQFAAHLAGGLQHLAYVLLHRETARLLLLQRLAAVLQLLRVALEQREQFGFGQLPELLAFRFPQGEFVGGGRLEHAERRQGRQLLSLFLQGCQLELQPFQQLGAGLLHVVLAQVSKPRQGCQQVAGQLTITLGAGRVAPRRPLLAVTQQRPGLIGQLVLGILQQPLAVAGELAGRQIVAVDARSHLFEQAAQRRRERHILLGELGKRLLAHPFGLGQPQGIAAGEVVAQGALQGTGEPLLQPFVLVLGLLGLVELLPAVPEGTDLHGGDQQQSERREGGIMGNFHGSIPAC